MGVEERMIRIREIANALKQDGFDFMSERLRRSHEGIFSGTELTLKWHWNLVQILELPSISERTRTLASGLLAELEKDLGYRR
jgi:hypothetical protein